MKKYKPIILKENINNANDLAKELEKEILHIFPHSYVDAEFSSHLYPSIILRFALGKDKHEWNHGYIENDPARMIINISAVRESNIDKEGNILGPLEVTNDFSRFYIKPPEGSYLAMGKIKIPFRKLTTDNLDKIIEYLKKYFMVLKKTLQENRENLMPEHLKLIGNKF